MQSNLLLLSYIVSVTSWTYIPVTDLSLVKTSEVIVYGTVKEELSEPPYSTNRVYRYYKVDVEDRILGTISDDSVVIVRSLGGYDAKSDTFYGYPGAPVLSTNEKVLLFLRRAEDYPSIFDFLHFGLGSFHELTNQTNSAESYAYRVSDATEDNQRSQVRKMRNFINWIRLAASSLDLETSLPSYWANIPSVNSFWSAKQEIHSRYNTMSTNGRNVKWQTFTTGGTVNWYINPTGSPSLLNGNGYNEIQQAFAAWNSATPDVTGVINYQFAGNTTASGGLATSDGQNSVLYEDPNNEISGSFSCSSGGTLAIGGWRARGTAFSWRSSSWYPITEADMVVQDGISCWISSNSIASTDWANMLTHEFGHTLAMGHSCGDTETGTCVSGSSASLATMRAYLRSGVGAALGDDDKEGINYLYASCWPSCTSISTTSSSQNTTGSQATGDASTSEQATSTGSDSTTSGSTSGSVRTTGLVITSRTTIGSDDGSGANLNGPSLSLFLSALLLQMFKALT